ncbi:MAG: hypothetical protein KOO63_07965 [Bacteroidales bacterium]|nr:hypothetical protein [Candidatus Latescibacterota bacterium]
MSDLIERLKHFQEHEAGVNDEYGAQVLYAAWKELERLEQHNKFLEGEVDHQERHKARAAVQRQQAEEHRDAYRAVLEDRIAFYKKRAAERSLNIRESATYGELHELLVEFDKIDVMEHYGIGPEDLHLDFERECT